LSNCVCKFVPFQPRNLDPYPYKILIT